MAAACTSVCGIFFRSRYLRLDFFYKVRAPGLLILVPTATVDLEIYAIFCLPVCLHGLINSLINSLLKPSLIHQFFRSR
jgi:hypothetical protein